MELSTQLYNLSFLRHRAEQVKINIEEAEYYLSRTETGQQIIAYRGQLAQLKSDIDTLEQEIKAQAVAEYERTGQKPTTPHIKIIMRKRLAYDKIAALNWAKLHLPEALTIDTKFFEEHAKAVANTTPIPGVTLLSEPTAQISAGVFEAIFEPINE